MASKDNKSIKYLILVFFLISFQTTPAVSDTIFDDMDYVPLDKGAFAYVFTNVKEARPILDIIPVQQLKNWQARLILESTDIAVAGLYPKGDSRHFQVTGWGDYPSLRARVALFFNTSWKKQRSTTGVYWHSAFQKISVVINPKQVFAIAWQDSHGNPVPAAPGIKMPEGFAAFMRGAPLSCWMESPSLLLNQILSNEGIPINLPAEQLFLNLYPRNGNQYEVILRLKFENAAQARTIAALIALASTLSANQQSVLASIFFANPPSLSGQNIEFKTALLSEKEITLLLQMFLVYWK